MKILSILSLLIVGILTTITPALAHVVVKPNQVGIATFQTFTVGVPNEKDNPTIAMRLLIPDGSKHISPNVKPGWKIDVKQEGTGEDARVVEINWTGGSIPAGQRDEFLFSLQVPNKETTLMWKAYQTYQDGTVVSWDLDPKSETHDDDESENAGPYSTTKVVNDITDTTMAPQQTVGTNKAVGPNNVLAIAALALASVSILMQLRKK